MTLQDSDWLNVFHHLEFRKGQGLRLWITNHEFKPLHCQSAADVLLTLFAPGALGHG